MRWIVTTPPATVPVDYTLAKQALGLPNDDDQTYIEFLIDAAVNHAQDAMSCSLVNQSITAICYSQDVFLTAPINTNVNPFNAPIAAIIVSFGSSGQYPAIKLTRGPVTAITSITDARGQTIPDYFLERSGTTDYVRLTRTFLFPLTITYTAGYGASATDVPASIRQAILTHVATMYDNRASISDQQLTPVPHSLGDFYRRNARFIGIA